MNAAFARHWKPGALAFVSALALCVVFIWQRQVRHNLVLTFSVQTMANQIELPSLTAANSKHIGAVLRLLIDQRSMDASISRAGGTFEVTVEAIPARSVDRTQQTLAAVYQELTDRFGKDIDTAPLAAQLNLLDARLALISQTLQSAGLSAHEQYALKDQALKLGVERAGVSKQLEILASGIFSRPTSDLYRARQMDTEVLLVLSLILSGFVACTTMVLAESLASST